MATLRFSGVAVPHFGPASYLIGWRLQCADVGALVAVNVTATFTQFNLGNPAAKSLRSWVARQSYES